MGDFRDSVSVEKGSDAWNIAQGFTTLKILKPLVECDKLVTMALYGVENIEFSLSTDIDSKISCRIEAINRLMDKLREIIENSNFVMKEDTLEDYENRLTNMAKYLRVVSKIQSNQQTGQNRVVINEEHFAACLDELRLIKKEILKPLNEKSLIFPSSDEIDLNKMQEDLINSG